MTCAFCDIIARRSPARIIYEDDHVLAFHDTAPQAPLHILVIPKKHIETLNDLNQDDMQITGTMVLRAKEIAQELGIAEKGYRLVVNCNRQGGQTIFHLHCHLLGGRRMAWPPG